MAFSPEQVVRQLLLTQFTADLPGDDRIGTDTPGDWTGRLPFVQVRNLGGTRAFNLHRPRLAITTWAADAGTAEDLAGRIDDFFVYRTPLLVGLISVGLSGTTQSPAWQPYDNPAVTRYGGVYRLSMHETQAA